MPKERRHRRGLLDASVVIDIEMLDPSQLPVEVAVSALTMAELAAGSHAATDPDERGRRQDRLQRAEAAFDPLPFDTDAARAYGRVSPPSWLPGAKPGVPEPSTSSSRQPPSPPAFRFTHATATTSKRSTISSRWLFCRSIAGGRRPAVVGAARRYVMAVIADWIA